MAPAQLPMWLGELLDEARTEALAEIRMPESRAECEGEGLCLKLSCRYNFTLEVTPAGSLRLFGSRGQKTVTLRAWDGYGRKKLRELAFRERGTHRRLTAAELDEFDERVLERLEGMDCNCVLDVVAKNPDGLSLDTIADLLGDNNRQRVNQVERSALVKARAARSTLKP